MTTSTQSLAGWLLERIAEDEAVARDAWRWQGRSEGRWHTEHVIHDGLRGDGEPAKFPGKVIVWNGAGQSVMDTCSEQDAAVGYHVAAWDPARVLAECESKRKIVELHGWMGPVMAGAPVSDPKWCITCADHVAIDSPPLEWPCPTLRALALPYADCEGYDESWRL